MDIELFREFGMVAKHGNLSETARELHVTESVLSRHLKTLETELGLELFDRTSNPMRLTAVGEMFLPLSSDVGNAMERVNAFCQTYRTAHVDIIRIRGIVDGVTLPLLRTAKARLESQSRSVRVRFMPHQFQTPFEDIRTGKLDIAVEPLSDLIEIHELSWFHVAFEKPYVVVEKDGPLARTTFSVADLATTRFTSLRSNRDNALRKHVQTLCKRSGLEGNVPKSLTLSPADSYEELLLEGLDGRALMLPANMASRYAQEFPEEYVAVPFEGEGTDYDLCAFYDEQAPAYVHAYLDILRELARCSYQGEAPHVPQAPAHNVKL